MYIVTNTLIILKLVLWHTFLTLLLRIDDHEPLYALVHLMLFVPPLLSQIPSLEKLMARVKMEQSSAYLGCMDLSTSYLYLKFTKYKLNYIYLLL